MLNKDISTGRRVKRLLRRAFLELLKNRSLYPST